ncbi:MAG: glycosyltransferase family 4 protein [Chloroflexota bacterium]|nr:glycosyltransferase family 4 protein [Chloroflexota bacterium]
MAQLKAVPTKVAVIFVNYGPYHRARALALQSVMHLEPHFVELASAQALYPWHASGPADTLTLTTLARGEYEQLPKGRITRAVWRALDRLDPHVVVGCGYSDVPMLAAAVWAKRKRRPYILMFETTEWGRRRPLWEELPKRAVLATLVNGVFCGGTAHRLYLNRLGVRAARIWEKYDVVDNTYFEDAADAARRDEDQLRVALGLPPAYFLYVGRFSPEKNIEVLLRAYAQYKKHQPAGYGLVLVGDGPQRENLQELASRLHSDDIVWTGRQGIGTLPTYYALARAFVLPSRAEPWGLVVNEAMACGLPVIISNRCGCAPDLVREGTNGFTFDPHNVDELGRHLHTMAQLEEPIRAQMAKASRCVVAEYTPTAWATNLAACVSAALAR